MNKISYCITVADEIDEFIKLVNLLITHKREEDNILILVDTNKLSEELENIVEYYQINNHIFSKFGIFGGNFSKWKNQFWESDSLSNYLQDYLFFIDADELPNPQFIEQLPLILDYNLDVDVFGVPRINFVEGITDEYIQQMNWRKDSQNRINYPDFQYRICKNKPELRWGGKVHETIIGFNVRTELPINNAYDLLHAKTFEKQQKQNNLYNSL